MQALLLDADGVIFRKGEYFSDKYAREHNVSSDKVTAFFKGPFVACQAGKADLKEELMPYLTDWGWSEGIEAFLDYWFRSDSQLDQAVVAKIKSLRQQGVKCCLASNNEHHRAKFLQTLLENECPLDKYYFSSHLKVRKEDSRFFEHIVDDLRLPGEEIYYLDNDEDNVKSAASLGIISYVYNATILDQLLTKI